MTDAQAGLPLTEPPAFTVKEVKRGLKKVSKTVKRLLKMKPSPSVTKDAKKKPGKDYPDMPDMGSMNFSDPNFFESAQWKEVTILFSGCT